MQLRTASSSECQRSSVLLCWERPGHTRDVCMCTHLHICLLQKYFFHMKLSLSNPKLTLIRVGNKFKDSRMILWLVFKQVYVFCWIEALSVNIAGPAFAWNLNFENHCYKMLKKKEKKVIQDYFMKGFCFWTDVNKDGLPFPLLPSAWIILTAALPSSFSFPTGDDGDQRGLVGSRFNHTSYTDSTGLANKKLM